MNRAKRFIAPVSVVIAASLVIGVLFLAVPSAVATSTATAPAVSALDASEDFTVTTTLNVGAGERIPVSFLEVRTISQAAISSGLANGLLPTTSTDDGFCRWSGDEADVTFSKNPTKSSAAFNGYGKRNLGFSSGTFSSSGSDVALDFDGATPSSTFGFGGSSAQSVKITLPAECDFDFDSSKPGKVNVFVQVLIGTSADLGDHIRSVPVKATFYDPAFKPAAANAVITDDDDVDAEVEQETTENGQKSTVAIGDDSGEGRAIGAGVKVAANTGNTQGATALQATVKTGIADADKPTDDGNNKLDAVPSGSQLSLVTATDADDAFDQDPDVFDDEADGAPFMAIQVGLDVPGKGNVDPARYFEQIDVTILLAKSNFDDEEDAGLFKLIAFHDDGTRKTDSNGDPLDPERLTGPTSSGGNYRWTFKITEFSSYSGIIVPVDSLAGTFDITSTTTVEHIDGANKITWKTAGGSVEGYQIWRLDGNTWTLIKETGPSIREYTDNNGDEADEYKVTYFTGDTLADGFSEDRPEDIPGWNDTDTVESTSHEEQLVKQWWFWVIILLIILFIVLLIIVILAAIRNNRVPEDDDWDDDDEWASEDIAETPFVAAGAGTRKSKRTVEHGDDQWGDDADEEIHHIQCPRCSQGFDVGGAKPIKTTCPNCHAFGILR